MEAKKNYNHNHNNNNKWKEKSHKNKYYEEIVPIHCFECYFTPTLHIKIPKSMTDSSSVTIKMVCPNDHKKILDLEKFIELTQKDSFSNIICNTCKQKNNSDFVFCKACKGYKCQNCIKTCSQHYLIPISKIDSTCCGHTYNNAPPKNNEIKINKNVEMKKGDWICSSCGEINFQRRTECFKCNSSKQGEEASFYCSKHLENFCQKCANRLRNTSAHEIKNLKLEIPSKEKADKLYDAMWAGKKYIEAVEDNYNELIKGLKCDTPEFQKISKIFMKFKNDNTNLVQLIKFSILSYKQHFFSNNIGIQVLHNLLSLCKIFPNDFSKKGSLTAFETFISNTKNYILTTDEEFSGDDKFKENNTTFYQEPKNNFVMPIRENLLKNLKKTKTIATPSNVFSIHQLKNSDFLIIFGKKYKFDFASLYNSNYKIKIKDLGMKLYNSCGNICKNGKILSNDQSDILFQNDDNLLKIYSKEKSYKKPQKIDCSSFDVLNDFLIIFYKGDFNLYIYCGNGSYQLKSKIYNTTKDIMSIHFIKDNLFYANFNFDSIFYDMNTKEEKLVKVPLIVKYVHSRVIIGYSYNKKIIVLGNKTCQMVQNVDMDSCYDCGQVDENSFLSQSDEYFLLWKIKTENIELIGRFEFKYYHYNFHFLTLPKNKFILYREYEDDWALEDEPEDSNKKFYIYSF